MYRIDYLTQQLHHLVLKTKNCSETFDDLNHHNRNDKHENDDNYDAQLLKNIDKSSQSKSKSATPSSTTTIRKRRLSLTSDVSSNESSQQLSQADLINEEALEKHQPLHNQIRNKSCFVAADRWLIQQQRIQRTQETTEACTYALHEEYHENIVTGFITGEEW